MTQADFRTDRFDGQIGNRILVEDGGSFVCTAPVQMPYTQEAGGFSSNLQVRVTGADSSFVVSNEFVLGYNQAAGTTNVNAGVYVADGGRMLVVDGNFIIGNGNSTDRVPTVCEDNSLWVGPGGQLECSVQAYKEGDSIKAPVYRIGSNFNAKRNLIRVEGMAKWGNRGVDKPDLFSVGYNGPSNRFEVVNGGRAEISRSGPLVGYGTPAVGNAIYVGADSTLVFTNTEYAAVGSGGADAQLTVDGGRLEAVGTCRVVLGSLYSASNAAFVVKNGGVATLTRLVLGDKAPNCSATVDDATLNLVEHGGISSAGYLDIGYSPVASDIDPRNATFTVKGRNAKVRIGRNIRMRNATAQIRFVVPAEGFAETPFVCTGGFETVTAGASIHVSADPAWPRGSKATLLTTGSTGHISALKLTCDPDLCIRRNGNAIVVNKMGGICIFIR